MNMANPHNKREVKWKTKIVPKLRYHSVQDVFIKKSNTENWSLSSPDNYHHAKILSHGDKKHKNCS